MTNFSGSWKHDQVFISFRGISLRDNIVSSLTDELQRRNINYFMDTCETKGRPITDLFERIRESSVALVFFSKKFPESCWCLDELVEIKKQMEIGSLDGFPIFYKVKAHSVKRQSGCFRNTLLATEESVRKKVDRGSDKSKLETEDMIWGWRQALVSVGGILGISHKHGPDPDLARDVVVKLKEMLDDISSRRSAFIIIEKPLMHPQKPVTSLLQALNLEKSDLVDLITRPSIHSNGAVSLRTDHLVLLDLISLKKPVLGQRLIEHGQVAGKIYLVLLGSLEINDGDFDFKHLLLYNKPQLFPGNKLIVSSQKIQDQSYTLPVQVTSKFLAYYATHHSLSYNFNPPLDSNLTDCADVVVTAESNDNLQNRLGEDNNTDDPLTCFAFLCNIMKRCAMIINSPPRRVFISFGEKQLGGNPVSSLETELESNGISVYVEDETKERIKESRVAIVFFSLKIKYPESQRFLDDLVEIKKLMDAGEIDPLPIFYNLKAESVRKMEGWFCNRLLKIEEIVRKKVNRSNEKSILDTEARIWGWREAILSISSRSGLSYEDGSSVPVFVTDVVTKVKELFAFRKRHKKSSSYKITGQLNEEKPLMHHQETVAAITTVKSLDDDDLFYSMTSFLQARNLEIEDLEGFTDIPKGLVSMRLKGYANLVFLNFNSLHNLVRFQRSISFKFIREVSPPNPIFLLLISINFWWLLVIFFRYCYSAGFCFESLWCHKFSRAFSGLSFRIQSTPTLMVVCLVSYITLSISRS
ncbi:unnamed protein product [Thlaspi arvense]|uniref:TIR domain-containing protein n=1 Tax=Thlaspi arvense TaxID=13288 RepID=A0AAU9SZV4_THLAR|nr:unnamed protein product [Thlaspi arvense]